MANSLTQPYTLQLRSSCPAAGVYLRWLSPLGNWEAWLFDGDTDPETTPEAGSVLQAEEGPALLRRGGVRKQLLRAGNLTPGQWETLTGILTSPQVYVQDAAGQLTPVLVVAAPAGRTSSDNRTTFDVQVQLGRINPLTRI